MPRFAQGPPHLVLTSHGSLDPPVVSYVLVSNRGRGKSLKNGSLRISQLTNKSTPTVTDASHGLHMPGTIMVFPYVYMYEIYAYFIVAVKLAVQSLFYFTVGAFETIGNMIWWCMGILPVTFSAFVKSTLLCWYTTLVAKMSNTLPTVHNKPITIRQTPLLFHVCFHVIHTVFIVAVHTWTLYTLQAYWTQTVSFVLL